METIRTASGKEVIIYAETFDNATRTQILRLAEHPAYQDSCIRIMPDCHAGKGCTVGTTMTISDKLTPNLVGVDIGCGMLTIELAEREIDFAAMDAIIRNHIPNGQNVHQKPLFPFDLSHLSCREAINIKRAEQSVGTLGGGNHFIEVGRSEKTGNLFLVIHSGSRKLGVDVCKYYQNKAEELHIGRAEKVRAVIEHLKNAGREREIQSELMRIPEEPRELCYLQGEYFDLYLRDMHVVQEFAARNRAAMAEMIISKMRLTEISRFETIHNYIDFSRMILRKGSVSAEAGERILIPINMRDGSLVCVGKGNPEWNYSAPHGAGRLMSRSEAFEKLSMDEYVRSMSGIYTTSVQHGTLDEAPQAYKPMEEIIRAIAPTAEIADILKPVYNFKASEM